MLTCIYLYNNLMFVRVSMKYFDNVFEGYLDADEEFYDYRTAEVSGDRIFDERTTGVSFYNQFLSSEALQYLRDKKNLVAEVVQMSPNEYYEECGKYAWHHTVSAASLKAQRAADKYTIEHLKQVIQVYKKRFPMPFINYAEKSQEGLHRMYVAGELFGWDSPKHPVLCVRWADEARHEKEERQKYLNEVESALESAVRAALRYTYDETSEFYDELQTNLDIKFEYFEEISKPVDFELTVADGVVSVRVGEVSYEFDLDEIQIDPSSDPDDDDLDIDLDDLELDMDPDEFLDKYLK